MLTRRDFTALLGACAAAASGVAPADAFAGLDKPLAQQLTDIQGAVVFQRGRPVFEYHRDGSPEALRDVQSVVKSGLATLVGIALAQGHFASVDQPVAALMPEWTHPDPRAASITLRHLLAMTAGFESTSVGGVGGFMPAAQGWARPLASDPGSTFRYDNANVALVSALLEKATGMPLAEFGRRHLGAPLGIAPATFERFRMRTVDMARLGQLWLQQGQWEGRQLMPAAYVAEATRAHTAGGPPVGMPYGFMWWIVSPRPHIYMASGYGGQLVWVAPAQDAVVAVASTVSPQSQQRGHSVQWLQRHLGPALLR